MEFLPFFLAAFGLLLVVFRFFPGLVRRRNGSRCSAVVWDGIIWRSYAGKRAAAGIECETENGKITYPFNVCFPHVVDQSHTLYVVAAERIPLASHEALEVGRQTILFKHLFKSGGDLLFFLQIAALVVPLLMTFWLSLQFGGVQDALKVQAVSIGVMEETLSKPLIAAPAVDAAAVENK